MILECTNNDEYQYDLTVGQKYDVEIQQGIFPGRYYAVFTGDRGKKCASQYWRFDIDKKTAEENLSES